MKKLLDILSETKFVGTFIIYQSCVFATDPAGDEDISWSSIRAWNEGPLFFGWTQGCTHAGVVQVIPELVMSCYSFTFRATGYGVVPFPVTLVLAGWAQALSSEDLTA